MSQNGIFEEHGAEFREAYSNGDRQKTGHHLKTLLSTPESAVETIPLLNEILGAPTPGPGLDAVVEAIAGSACEEAWGGLYKSVKDDVSGAETVKKSISRKEALDLVRQRLLAAIPEAEKSNRISKTIAMYALFVLAKVGGQDAHAAILGAMKCNEPEIVSLAAYHILHSGNKAFLNPLLILLKTAAPPIRESVMKAFLRKPVREIIPPLVCALEVKDPKFHEQVMECLRVFKADLLDELVAVASAQGEPIYPNIRIVADNVLGPGKYKEIIDQVIRRSSGRVPKILVVDDQVYIRKALQYSLKKMNFDVVTAGNGSEAISVAARERPDLILMDTMMPIMDGISATIKLKEHAELAGIPVIMLTARAAKKHVIDAVSAGAVDYIVKPYSLDIVIEKINKVLGKVG